LNLGLEQAHAPLVARMDADDLMLPTRLERQYAATRADRGISVLGTRVRAFSAEPLTQGYAGYIEWLNACVSEEDIAADIFLESPLAHPSVMFHRERILDAGGYRQGPFPEDYELWLRLHQRGERIGKLPHVLLLWRDHPGRLSRSDARCAREAFDRLRSVYLAEDPRLQGARSRLVIWGAGRKTRKRADALLRRGFHPIAWIDIDPRKLGNRIRGVRVEPPEWLATRSPKPLVLVYVSSHGARTLIDRALLEMDYRRGIDYLHVG
jgi:glycosyltransferase involved in cell wall biosynthesis